MKLTRSRIEPFLRAPDPDCRIVLLYGPDQGLISERAKQLAATVVEDLRDPFLVSRFSAADLRQDPTQLADTASTFSMTGGRRLLWVSMAAEDISPALQNVLDGPGIDGLVVIEAGDLTPRAPARKLCEADDAAAAIACYADDAGALSGLIQSVAREHGVQIDREAESFLLQYLGADRAASRAELEKLALYVGSGGTATLAEAMIVVGDGAALSIDEIIYCMTEGDISALDRHLTRAFNDGTAPITLIRAAMRHVQRLHQARAVMDTGQPADQAMKQLRPPVMFFHTARFRRALEIWATHRLAQALEVLTDAEIDCKTTGLPDQAICSRAFIRLANGARQGAPRRRQMAG